MEAAEEVGRHKVEEFVERYSNEGSREVSAD